MEKHPKSANTDLANPPVVDAAFGDVDEQAAALTGWNQNYVQLCSGSFQGGVRQLELEGVRVFLESVSTSIFQTGALATGTLALGVPIDCQEDGLFCGQACGMESLHVFSGQSGFEFRTAGQHVMLGIETAPSVAHSVLADWDEDDGSLSFPRHAGIHLAHAPAMDELRQLVALLFEAVNGTPGLLALPSLRVGMAEAVLERIIALQVKTLEPSPKSLSHWRLVQEAQQMVNDQLSQPPSIADLCAHLGTSRRTLQSGFQQVLGLSPLAYLRVARLGAARRSLKSAESVTDAATQHGFWHFGHFAKDYQEMFDELPSQTLKRHRE